MIATAKQLRYQVGELLDLVDLHEEVIITYRGKPRAKLVLISDESTEEENPVLGMWDDRDDMDDVAETARSLRRGRSFDAS